MELEINVEEVEGRIVVRGKGRLDTLTAPQLEKRLNAFIDDKKCKILIDFSEIDYLSSAGMRLLLSSSKKVKREGGYLIVFSVDDEVMEVIRMAGLDKVLIIKPSEKEALQFKE